MWTARHACLCEFLFDFCVETSAVDLGLFAREPKHRRGGFDVAVLNRRLLRFGASVRAPEGVCWSTRLKRRKGGAGTEHRL